MSITDRIVQEKTKKTKNGNGKTGSVSNGSFISFNPTKEQKTAIRASELSLTDDLDYISTWLSDGHKMSWMYSQEHEAYAVFLRQGNVDWREALVLSCWHVDWEIAIRMLAFALNNVYKTFPVVEEVVKKTDLEW